MLDRRVENRPISAKSTMASNLDRSSARLIPRMAPFRKMFSRPVSSMEAGADLQQAADATEQLDAPACRLDDARQDLRRVLLPAPLRR